MGNLTDPRYIRALCEKYDFRLKKSLGQNFLHDASVLEEIVEAALPEGGGALEIGPGFGVLTEALAGQAERVVAVEIDDRLLPVLDETLAPFDNVSVVHGDVLKLDLPALLKESFGDMPVSVAANLPYYITTPILLALLEKNLPLRRIVVMMQKEVADRIMAAPGGKDYGALTVAVQYRCEVRRVCRVPAASFFPPPKVDSEVLCLSMRENPVVRPKNEDHFFALVRAVFAQRRKTLVNGLANAGRFGTKEKIATAVEKMGLSPTVRGETLSIAQLSSLSDALYV
ncbi:MAG: 16S rRNA (adenine(1518)-N(6)/adenine(1519)-N(6))-dimethyltransferase RsmA [Ruminococcaceae bacterium]|nr:16S rRNA (adenine(1518)-N(6)/adenine(1519)-N(6))-dimethyltransferase RsmA [Oscillospiraceae bacterium]